MLWRSSLQVVIVEEDTQRHSNWHGLLQTLPPRALLALKTGNNYLIIRVHEAKTSNILKSSAFVQGHQALLSANPFHINRQKTYSVIILEYFPHTSQNGIFNNLPPFNRNTTFSIGRHKGQLGGFEHHIVQEAIAALNIRVDVMSIALEDINSSTYN